MRVVLQRVRSGSVTVNGERVSEVGPGLVILVGVGKGDGEAQADWLAEKIANLRIFEDDAGKMNRSVLEMGGSALVVSQFTLYADSQKGRRPSFIDAALPDQAEPLISYFANRLQFHGVPVQTGVFRAEMLVEIHNDGPVTIVLEK
ncbi:MAG: D-aminoacyl-tRNA deacylase [Anaerolineales bacterium]